MIQKMVSVNPGDELYHYGVLGMKWGVRRAQQKIDKYRKKARQYDKYSKEYAKEGSRRYGSDGARQTDKEIAWMKKLAADNKAKSQKYEALAQKIETKVKAKASPISKRQRDMSRATRGIDKDIQSFKPYTKTGIRTKNGKLVMSSADVNAAIKALEKVKDKKISKINARYDKRVNAINRDIESYRPHMKTGIRTKDGKVVVTREDVLAIIAELEDVRKKYE